MLRFYFHVSLDLGKNSYFLVGFMLKSRWIFRRLFFISTGVQYSFFWKVAAPAVNI
jgi:hypothetical protein